MSGGSCAPIENSPPGIHTMPSGAGAGGSSRFSTVGRKSADPATSVAAGLARSARAVSTAAPAMTAAVSDTQMPRRRLMWTTLFHFLKHLVEVEAGRLLALRKLLEGR